ncbi:hypothetical protein [Pseudomonas sp. zfem003]|uniref:hypothetical protein n=1 Tax=Pseudomonas sp. zfem003 TaxID=3078198 RepID=UPI0029280275|nr:hypothetical protein [Pseudomonas sp. zfem003]MDU9395403.1 hypothetical protein [Pseudomonas sp. zfem003]
MQYFEHSYTFIVDIIECTYEAIIINKEIITILIAYLSFLVAAQVLSLTSMQVSSQRKYNRLMVRPHLDGTSCIDDENKKFSYEIANNGIGPAIIMHAEIYYKGELVTSEDPVESAMQLIEVEHNEYIEGWGHHKVALGTHLKPGDTISLIEVDFKEINLSTPFNEFLTENVILKIWFKSIYDEYFFYSSDEEPIKNLEPLPEDERRYPANAKKNKLAS